jgi:pilus assembly protein CpaD
MTRTTLLLAALSLPLAACMGTENRGLESVHQPVVDRADYALDLQTAGGGLASGEQARLVGWLGAMQLGYGDRVGVDDPDGYASGARAEVGGVVAGYGLLVADDAPVTASPVAPGTVRVVVSRMRASVPGCPDWSRTAEANFDNHTSSNHGCATNRNLAAMVASPADLVRGQTGSGSFDPVSSGKAIDTFRKQVPTGAGGVKAEQAGAK